MAAAPPLKSFDRVAGIYNATRGFPREAEAKIAGGLLALLPGGRPRLLEVGVGSGRMAAPLAAAGVSVIGIDISAKMLGLLRERAPEVQALFAEAAHLPFRDGAFDGALFVHILHLVPDVSATVREAIRAVRPGGILFACETSYKQNALTRAGHYLREVTAVVTGRPLVPAVVHESRHTLPFREVMLEAGIVAWDVVLARWREPGTGRNLLEATRAKSHSHTWWIPDALIPEIIERATPGVDEICKGLDTVYQNEASFNVCFGRLP